MMHCMTLIPLFDTGGLYTQSVEKIITKPVLNLEYLQTGQGENSEVLMSLT